MNTTSNRIYGVRATVPTWKMTDVELARTWAAHYGYTARPGGWIYDQQGRPVVQGWDSFAQILADRRFIVQGSGIDWRRAGRNPYVRPA